MKKDMILELQHKKIKTRRYFSPYVFTVEPANRALLSPPDRLEIEELGLVARAQLTSIWSAMLPNTLAWG